MGHTRLGWVPKTQRWEAVVSAILEPVAAPAGTGTLLADDVPAVAQQALEAAEAGLERAIDDVGLQHTVYVLTQVVLAVREPDWQQRLGALGITLPPTAGVMDLTAAVQAAIDDHIESVGRHTDVSEMAQQAAGEALATLTEARAVTLFGQVRDELLGALKSLSTKDGFARLGQKFFGQFMSRFLGFYLSRITAAGMGGDRLHQLGDLAQFNDALRTHCEESAQIVKEFSGSWFSKTEWEKGITPENTLGFVAVALKKLQAELKQQGAKP